MIFLVDPTAQLIHSSPCFFIFLYVLINSILSPQIEEIYFYHQSIYIIKKDLINTSHPISSWPPLSLPFRRSLNTDIWSYMMELTREWGGRWNWLVYPHIRHTCVGLEPLELVMSPKHWFHLNECFESLRTEMTRMNKFENCSFLVGLIKCGAVLGAVAPRFPFKKKVWELPS
jgi:hypothetical protein